MNHHVTSVAILLAMPGALAACTTSSESGAVAVPVTVDLRLRETPEAAYQSVSEVFVPPSHVIGDGLFPYEGIGWENGYVGYRLYLDGRLVTDIFGKQRPDHALAGIARFGSYHALASWGMDVLKVGPSLGIGGLGVMREGKPAQFGAIPRLFARIENIGGDEGTFVIEAGGIEADAGSSGQFSMRYTMGKLSPLTRVAVTADPALPLASGIVMHDGASFLQSAPGSKGPWHYIATFGPQSENKDNLGMALFYRVDQASYGGLANTTHFVTFAAPQFEYAFLAAWERDESGVRNITDFETLLEREIKRLQAGMQEDS
ncbi:DUF4861 family protein [Erythrobacter sp.]|uniref:DUF4861 family protein n=1 Tax=Erythrobacter sp. TaxID=1042 RepID=UPI0025FC9AAB|nr:DUF4861 family protein [Erythrobacter sp.]